MKPEVREIGRQRTSIEHIKHNEAVAQHSLYGSAKEDDLMG